MNILLLELILILITFVRTVEAEEPTCRELPRIRFEEPSSWTQEGERSHAVYLQLVAESGPIENELTANVVDSSDRLSRGNDYRFHVSRVTFPIGSMDGERRKITIEVLDDSLLEGSEQVLFEIAGMSHESNSVATQATHEMTIIDEDRVSIAFDAASSTADESIGLHQVWLRLSAPGVLTAVPLSVTVRDSQDGSAIVNRDYVTFGERTLTFKAGSKDGTMQWLNFEVIPDLLAEAAEEVHLSISGASHPEVVIGKPSKHRIWIVSNMVRGFSR